eukprot:SAG31_NODE_4033_length_3648_cov_1.803043_5_plen_94_part_00
MAGEECYFLVFVGLFSFSWDSSRNAGLIEKVSATLQGIWPERHHLHCFSRRMRSALRVAAALRRCCLEQPAVEVEGQRLQPALQHQGFALGHR